MLLLIDRFSVSIIFSSRLSYKVIIDIDHLFVAPLFLNSRRIFISNIAFYQVLCPDICSDFYILSLKAGNIENKFVFFFYYKFLRMCVYILVNNTMLKHVKISSGNYYLVITILKRENKIMVVKIALTCVLVA